MTLSLNMFVNIFFYVLWFCVFIFFSKHWKEQEVIIIYLFKQPKENIDFTINGILIELSISSVSNFLRTNYVNITCLGIKLKHGIGTEPNLRYLDQLGRSIGENTVLEELQLLEHEAISVGAQLHSTTIVNFLNNASHNTSLKKIHWLVISKPKK